MQVFYQMLVDYFRNLFLVAITGGEGALVDLPGEELAKLKQQVEGASRETLQRYLDILMTEEETARRSAERAPEPRGDSLPDGLAGAPDSPSMAVLSRMEGLERRLGGGILRRVGGAGRGDGSPRMTGNPKRLRPGWRNRSDGTGRTAPDGEPRFRAGPTIGCGVIAGSAAGHSGGLRPSPAAVGPADRDSCPKGGPNTDRQRRNSGGGRWTDFKDFVKRQDAALWCED